MKAYLLLLIGFQGLTLSLFSQKYYLKSELPEDKEYTIYGSKVVESKQYINTSIAYLSPEQLQLQGFKKFPKGGVIQLFIKRETIGKSSFKRFTILVGSKKYRIRKNDQLRGSDKEWINSGYVKVRKKLKEKFKVRIQEKNSIDVFDFEVES